MSDTPTTPLPPPSSSILPDPHRQPLHLPLIHGGATSSTTIPITPSSSSSLVREYRKGNWTIQETLILITAKKLDDERRHKTTTQDPTRPGGACGRTSGELRWKWVENYCWSQGCLRSQNQCNDKWDNLLRDYKKVRDYESKSKSSSDGSKDFPSYWSIDKHQRKERNLPSNMMLEVYQAISEVLQRKYAQRSPQQQQPPPQVVTAVSSSPVAIQPPPPPPPLPSPIQQPPPSPQAPASSTPAVSGKCNMMGVVMN